MSKDERHKFEFQGISTDFHCFGMIKTIKKTNKQNKQK